jgi:hypothetical protein
VYSVMYSVVRSVEYSVDYSVESSVQCSVEKSRVYLCIMYIMSLSAFVGKHFDCRNTNTVRAT